MSHRIANVAAVFGAGKAIKSVDAAGVTTWFYRNDDRDFVADHDHAGRHTVDRDTVERNIDHEHTTVETVPVDESPFAE